MAAFARRTTMPACIPGVEGEVVEPEFLDYMGHPAAMLVAAMQEHDGALRRAGAGGPEAVEKLHAVMARKCRFHHAVPPFMQILSPLYG